MPKLTETQVSKAMQIFLGQNPAITSQLLTITQAEADALGTTVEDLRKYRTFAAIDNYARERGEDPTKLLFTLAAANFEEFDRMWNEHQVEVNRALGLE